MKKLALLLLLYSGIFSSVFADSGYKQKISAENDKFNKWYYINNFSDEDYRKKMFVHGISIYINSYTSIEDSLHFKNIIDTIQNLIKPEKIQLVSTKTEANITISVLNKCPGKWWMEYCDDPRMKLRQDILPEDKYVDDINLYLYDVVDQEERNRMITYYLVRAITGRLNQYSKMKLPRSIFSERDPLNSKFLEIDKLMVKWYCSGKSDKYLRACYPSYIEYYKARNNKAFSLITKMIAFAAAFLFFIILLYTGILNLNAKRYFPFIYNVSLIVLCYIVYENVRILLFCSQYSFPYRYFAIILFLWIGFFSMVYFLEKLLFSFIKSFYLKLIIQFVSIVVLGGIGLSIYCLRLDASDYLIGFVNYMITLIIIGLVRVLYNLQRYKTEQLIMQKDVDLSRLSELKSKAELNALQSRINPHFLYNSLNSIATLARIDGGKTEKMALALSDFCRFATNKTNETYTSVEEEVNVVRAYLEIEKIRFGSRLEYSIDVEKGLEGVRIPRFIIQPLIENAIKHGISKITGDGFVSLTVNKIDDSIQIKVSDNGPDFPEDIISGHGLQSIHDKLEILYKDEATMNWESGEHKYICIVLPLPN